MASDSLIFDVSVPAEDAVETFSFTLRFTHPDGHREDHEFACFAKPGAASTLTLTALVQYDDRGQQTINPAAVPRYFRKAMPPDDWQRLDALIESRAELTLELLVAVFEKIVEKHVGRPLGLRLASSPGPSTTGRPSTAQRSSMASI